MSTQCLFINSGINGCKEKKKKPAPIQIDNPTIVEEVLIGGKDVLVAGVGTLVGTVNELFGGRQNGRTSYREESSYGGVRLNSEDADEISKHFAHGEILDHQGIGHETGDLGRDSTGE